MKQKMLRIISCMLMVVLFATLSLGSVSAEGVNVQGASITENTLQENFDINPMSTSDKRAVTLPINGSGDIYINLDSYMGLTRRIYFNATCSSNSGAVFLYVYSPRGTLVSNDWIIGVNEAANWSVFLPSSGEWHIHAVAQGNAAEVELYAVWQN